MVDVSTDCNAKNIENIEASGFDVLRCKGSGTYGFVYEVGTNTGDLYAFKYIKPDSDYKASGIKCLNEIDILMRVQHPHIMHAVNVLTKHNSEIDGVAIVLPLADRTLFDLLRSPSITTCHKIPIFFKLASALEFLHANNILHLDIKADNVILQNGTPFFIDFGSSMVVDDVNKGKCSDQIRGTLDHRAPELLSGSKVYNASVDIWAFGIMMLYILSGRGIYPVDFSLITEDELSSLAINIFSQPKYFDKFLINVSDRYRPLCKDLLTNILAVNPSKRYTASQILQHPLFNECRTNISGKLVDSGVIANFNRDHRDIIKLLIYWAKLTYPDSSAEILFLAVDLFNRVSAYYYDKSAHERMAISATCLWVASKMILDKFLSLDSYLKIICQNAKVTSESVLQYELELIHNLGGVLNLSHLYKSCKTSDALKLSLNNIILSRDQTVYADVDIPAWLNLIKSLPGDSPKQITISQLLS